MVLYQGIYQAIREGYASQRSMQHMEGEEVTGDYLFQDSISQTQIMVFSDVVDGDKVESLRRLGRENGRVSNGEKEWKGRRETQEEKRSRIAASSPERILKQEG